MDENPNKALAGNRNKAQIKLKENINKNVGQASPWAKTSEKNVAQNKAIPYQRPSQTPPRSCGQLSQAATEPPRKHKTRLKNVTSKRSNTLKSNL